MGILFNSCTQRNSLEQVKTIPYPSASGIEHLDKHLYVIGDDANSLLILDEDLNITDSISLFGYPGKRIPKDKKEDLEAITVLPDKKLLLIGSGSLYPNRYGGWLIDPVSKQKTSLGLTPFYYRLHGAGLTDLNIEGLCTIPGGIILSNRGNKSNPRNHLIVTGIDFWNSPETERFDLISIAPGTDSSSFTGISGLTYSKEMDWLILTASTEDTRNSLDDGAIGKSYLWVVKDISSKRNWKAINPDISIDLEEIDERFKGQKIESACILKETKSAMHLVLVADNDNGSSGFFKLIIQKKD